MSETNVVNTFLERADPDQRKAIEHPLGGGPAILVAGAGSGKTFTLTGRVAWLISVGVAPYRILAVTFTNKAADELRERIGVTDGDPYGPRISTIHSLALAAIRKDPSGFGLRSKISPLDTMDQADMIDDLVAAKFKGPKKDSAYADFNKWGFLEKIGYHRARGLGFSSDYTPIVHEQARKYLKGRMALNEFEVTLWREYEEAKTAASALDFDDMIHLVVRRGLSDEHWAKRLGAMFEHVLVDESQDTSPIQWAFLELLVGDTSDDLFAVGDSGQCQPPGTLVHVVDEPAHGRTPAKCSWRGIETLRDGEQVVVWCKGDQRTYKAGRSVRLGVAPYKGSLLKLHTEVGDTEVTPNHWCWARFNEGTRGKYHVYLMYRGDLGFRVGISVIKRKNGRGKTGEYGLSARFQQEKADKAWILKICDSRPEAEAWEELFSIRYQIPESMFDADRCWFKTKELIQMIFAAADPDGGRRCLEDLGLLESHPIMVRETVTQRSWRGFFKVAACNLLPGLMDVPIEGNNKSTLLLGVSRRSYSGLVYSLDVEKEHTYVADGIVTGNSIMGFQGAMPEILVGMAKEWRGMNPTVYKLERNYRSVPGIVKLANQIQSNMKDTIPLIMASMREAEEGGCMWMMSGASEREIAAKIAERIALDNRGGAAGLRFKDNAILVRAKSQIGDVESELIRYRVPYVIRGGQGIFQTMEAKDLVAYLRIISNPRDVVAFTRACSVPRRGIGEVGIRALQVQANKGHEGNLILAAVASPNPKMNDFGTFVLQFQNALAAGGYGVVEILNVLIREIGYRELIKARYRDKPDVAEMKLEALTKIVDAIGGIEESVGQASLEDIVFRLTMDREEEDGTESTSGKAVISTIHSSKGLEWERVFVTNVYEGSLPHTFSVTDKEVEEERRLFYVACTRARSRLHICVPNSRQLGPQTRSVQPSRFLDEIRPKRSA